MFFIYLLQYTYYAFVLVSVDGNFLWDSIACIPMIEDIVCFFYFIDYIDTIIYYFYEENFTVDWHKYKSLVYCNRYEKCTVKWKRRLKGISNRERIGQFRLLKAINIDYVII